MIRFAHPRTSSSFTRNTSRLTPSPSTLAQHIHARLFATTKQTLARNRIYTPIRNSEDFNNALLLSTSQDRALLTLWTASWCASCAVIAPQLRKLLAEHGVGEDAAAGRAVNYAEIELDSPDIAEVAGRFVITSVPTLVSFSANEMQGTTRVTDVPQLKDEAFLRSWIEVASKRGGGGGGVGGKSIFGGLFGSWFGSGGR